MVCNKYFSLNVFIILYKYRSETQVLVLSGVSRILSIKLDLLLNTEDFYKTWTLLLEFIETSALSRNTEVSLSALKCFQEILCLTKVANHDSEQNGSQSLWDAAWNSWYIYSLMVCTFIISILIITEF